jgi:flagella basal body P-ring formation protein FlgA
MHSSHRILAAAMLLVATHAATAARLSLKPEAMVDGPRVTLGDVAAIDGSDRTDARVLAAIDLGSAPLPGYTQRFMRKEIERLVRSHGLGGAVEWRGAEAIRVERVAKVFDTAQIADSAAGYLHQLLKNDYERFELQLSGPLPDLQLPNGKIELRPRPMLPAQAVHRRVTVWVDILIDGVFLRSLTVPFTVHAYRAVLVAKRDLSKGAVPQCETLLVREEDVAVLDGAPVAPDCHALQGHLKRALAQGAPLLKMHLQAPVAVTQGDNVSLQLVDGAVMLESRAIALADGEVGQRIKVKPSGGTETIMVEVIASGIVKVNGK